jgi:type 1 glutamine amidotransferase
MAIAVLVLCDDKWHPARVVRAGVAALGTEEFTFEVIEDARMWSAAQMARYPLVLLAKANHISATENVPWITPDVEEAFVSYVRGGGGLLVVHSGTIVRETPTLQRLIGGTFVHHPPQCEVTITPQGYHPITENVDPFTVMDEHYFVESDDLQAHYFLTTTSPHGAQEGGWWREEGEGRVCVLTPGHNAEVWLHAEFQTLLRNALLWCHNMEP